MNKLMIHMMIYCMSIIGYFYLNDINNPFQMCHFLIKFICCNKNLTDSDKTFEPTNVPMEDIANVANSVEHIVDDIISPVPKVKKMVRWFDDKKKD